MAVPGTIAQEVLLGKLGRLCREWVQVFSPQSDSANRIAAWRYRLLQIPETECLGHWPPKILCLEDRF
jgi:hypothetical protein